MFVCAAVGASAASASDGSSPPVCRQDFDFEPMRSRDSATETQTSLQVRNSIEPDSSPSNSHRLRRGRRRGHGRGASVPLPHVVPAYPPPSEAMLQSIVDECCAKAAASGRLQVITEHSRPSNPCNDQDFLSQCAALSEALSRTSESSAPVTPSRTSRSHPCGVVSGSLPPTAAMTSQPKRRNAVSGKLGPPPGAVLRDGARTRTR